MRAGRELHSESSARLNPPERGQSLARVLGRATATTWMECSESDDPFSLRTPGEKQTLPIRLAPCFRAFDGARIPLSPGRRLLIARAAKRQRRAKVLADAARELALLVAIHTTPLGILIPDDCDSGFEAAPSLHLHNIRTLLSGENCQLAGKV